jgi:hypothetical protein
MYRAIDPHFEKQKLEKKKKKEEELRCDLIVILFTG